MNTMEMKVKTEPHRCTVGEKSFEAVGKTGLANMAFQIYLIREFEQTLLKLFGDGSVHGPVHTSIGEEACAAGAMAGIGPEDMIASTHRAHHHYLAKLISFYQSGGFEALGGAVPEALQTDITHLMGEIMGLSIGCCGGRGGSMHLRNARIGVIGTNAIVGGGIPLATGAAFAQKYKNSGKVVVCFLGDGAVNQGSFHEALNLAGIWKLPVIYFVENNLYAVATATQKSTATEDIAVKSVAYGIEGVIVDGMDPVAVRQALLQAAERARQGGGATLIEAKCYRYLHHAGSAPGSGFGYRGKDEEDQWSLKDPHSTYPKTLVAHKVLTEEQNQMLLAMAQQAVLTAREACARLVDGKLVTREELWPDPKTVQIGIRSDGREFKNAIYHEKEDFSEFTTLTYSEAIAAVTGRHLEQDADVFVLGEEVANFGGGPYGATKGLPQKYPSRVLNTPISECGFSGLGGGAAMCGLKPVVEIMFPDFALVAADQLFNQIGKLRHMYGNSTDMPVVVRTRIAIGCGYGGQHSMDPVGIFALFSGWHIVSPSNAFDYVGLFNAAMRCKDPVVVIEHHALYPRKFEIPKDNLDYLIPLGKARVVQTGKDITLLCYGISVSLVQEAAAALAEQGIAAEVIDLRTLSLFELDYETIGESLKKTNVMAIIEQAPASMTLGPRIACEVQKRFFDYLDAPIETLGGLDIPNPVSRRLEAAAVPNSQAIQNLAMDLVKRKR